ncbi:hypothetical protein GW17_00029418 [Ensete ventricosum]|nr:hypothetical protein GW17_00029418 [Ensete ventricosum]RZS25292.1 hypothetical protein BHM03_00058473 [Ensete ventricosum]
MTTMRWTSRLTYGYSSSSSAAVIASRSDVCLIDCRIPELGGQACLELQAQAGNKRGSVKNSSSFLKATTTTLLHTIGESEQGFFVAHINGYLGDDPFLKNYLPLDPASDDLFNLAKDGVLLW